VPFHDAVHEVDQGITATAQADLAIIAQDEAIMQRKSAMVEAQKADIKMSMNRARKLLAMIKLNKQIYQRNLRSVDSSRSRLMRDLAAYHTKLGTRMTRLEQAHAALANGQQHQPEVPAGPAPLHNDGPAQHVVPAHDAAHAAPPHDVVHVGQQEHHQEHGPAPPLHH